MKVLTVVLEYPDNNLTERLFSICPALEDLSIEGHLDDKSLINFNISSTTLKRLCLSFTNGVAYSNNWHKVMIATPNLELLDIHDFCMVSYMFHELPPFTKVFIDIFYDDGWSWVQSGRAQRLLNSLTKAKFLALSADTVYVSPLHHVLSPHTYLIHVSTFFFGLIYYFAVSQLTATTLF